MAQSKHARKARREEPTLVAGGARRTIMLALWLTSFIPLIVLAYSFYTYLYPLLDHTRRIRDLPWLQALLVLTGLLMAGGGPPLHSPHPARPPPPRRALSRARAHLPHGPPRRPPPRPEPPPPPPPPLPERLPPAAGENVDDADT